METRWVESGGSHQKIPYSFLFWKTRNFAIKYYQKHSVVEPNYFHRSVKYGVVVAMIRMVFLLISK